MNQKTALMIAAAIGLFLLLRKPAAAQAETQADDTPPGGGGGGTKPPGLLPGGFKTVTFPSGGGGSNSGGGSSPVYPGGGVTPTAPKPSGGGSTVLPSNIPPTFHGLVDEGPSDKDKFIGKIVNIWKPIAKPSNEPKQPGDTPQTPSDEPLPGKWYRVRSGDSMSGIVVAAGLPARSWRIMRDHDANEWIPTGIFRTNQVEKEWKLYKRYQLPGYNTVLLPKASAYTVYPVVYVPTLDEVS